MGGTESAVPEGAAGVSVSPLEAPATTERLTWLSCRLRATKARRLAASLSRRPALRLFFRFFRRGSPLSWLRSAGSGDSGGGVTAVSAGADGPPGCRGSVVVACSGLETGRSTVGEFSSVVGLKVACEAIWLQSGVGAICRHRVKKPPGRDPQTWRWVHKRKTSYDQGCGPNPLEEP